MPRELVRSLIEGLPRALQEQIEGYAATVEASSEDILEEAHVPLTGRNSELLVYLAAVHRLWTIVSGQYWILDNSLSLLAKHEVGAIRIESNTYYRQSKEHQTLRQLREDLYALLNGLGLGFLTEISRPAEIALHLREADGEYY